jgi:hypothetical protein
MPRDVTAKKAFPSGDIWHCASGDRVYGSLNIVISIPSRTVKGRDAGFTVPA